MSERVERKPYEHTLHLINTVGQSIDRMAETPDGRPRDLDGPTAVGTLIAVSNSAIAAALLAVADAIRSSATGGGGN
ncbi:hypothetical protein OG481_02290 [Streptomyces longwoodensis]|uniref:hypothetical protein n=1 Tax=Streptomyces longwoodensis TaxID=68231 RepID=UPI002DD952C3|nr:hypothetical protein [Streptomyces longwoodensis]WRY87423.1 hypothetical protein OG481_02290 [Streptomyces longwoodensis]